MIIIFVGSEINGYRELYPTNWQFIPKLPVTIIARALYFRTYVEDGTEPSTEEYFVTSAADSPAFEPFYVSVLGKTQELPELAILAQAVAEKLPITQLGENNEEQKSYVHVF